MSRDERLLRIAGLIIILRDELEELGRLPEWVDVANDYLDVLTGKDDEVNEEYNVLFHHIDSVIREVDEPFNLLFELMFILKKDLKRCKIKHEINETTQKVSFPVDVKKVKILDSKIRLV